MFQVDTSAKQITVSKTIDIKFSTITCAIDPVTGVPDAMETSALSIGQIAHPPLQLSAADRGLSKDVYKVSIPSLFF
jgi:hypothetical protein